MRWRRPDKKKFLVFLAVLTPHLLGLYTLGQRFGMID